MTATTGHDAYNIGPPAPANVRALRLALARRAGCDGKIILGVLADLDGRTASGDAVTRALAQQLGVVEVHRAAAA